MNDTRTRGNIDAGTKALDLKGMTAHEIERFCTLELGQKPGRGLVVAAQIFRNRIEDLDAMAGVNSRLKQALKLRCKISTSTVEKVETSKDGTKKLLYRLCDDNAVEGVLIPGPNNRLTLCISTQAGCASGCAFCLTGRGGLVRNLSTAEMVNQVFGASRVAGSMHITNLVLMGSGEPLANYEAVKAFVEIATHTSGMGFSPKRVTISTCGLAPMIRRMADEGINASLAVSLNASTDEVRSRLMPINQTYPLNLLMQTLEYYVEKSGRSVTIEYVLFKGVNDSSEDAVRLADLLERLPCMVNILLFNPFPGCGLERPSDERASVFRDILVSRELVAVVRKSRGRDISAACGQLSALSSNAHASPVLYDAVEG